MKLRIMKASLLGLALCLVPIASREGNLPKPPPECNADYNFANLDQNTIRMLTAQGSLMVIRQKKDLSLVNVTAGQVVNAPAETVWQVVTDFPNYPKFLPQTAEIKVLSREADRALVEQTLAIKVWQLPSVEITYQLAYQLEQNRIRFWWAGGSIPGTYGGWDLVPAGKQTLVFYTLYSNLTTLGWGLGSALKSQPDFFAGINVTTALLTSRAVKEESERRARR